jgi:flagella basal body P-ring formation protein FlgA
MAALTITATSVVKVSGDTAAGVAATTITAGQNVSIKSDLTLTPTDNNDADPLVRKIAGVALNGGAAGQPIQYLKSGVITIGATVTPGTVYVAGATAGAIAPAADLASGNEVSILGVGKSATQIALGINNSGCTV